MKSSFLKYLSFERRYSPHTVSSYSTDLEQFSAFLKSEFEIANLEEALHPQVRAWLIHLVEKKLSPTTINRKISTLRAYYKFLLKREAIQVNPTAKVRVLKKANKLPRFVKEDDMVRLLENLHYSDNFAGQRDKMVLELLYGTGIRLAELLGLTEEQIDLEKKEIKVLGKRNKERIIPLSGELTTVISRYKSIKIDEFRGMASKHLIVTDEGKIGYPMLIYRITKNYLAQFTTLDKRSPHVLRHTFATHLLNKGAELNAVKELLGHSSLAATQVYTHNSLEKLKDVFAQAHPKA
ncbi:MAG: tyrosine-type recombinase/integrase [Cyclobacteriaceae bacterium]|nr:tyrosine-type recombinase/integrase [Cyclobacteriaceae bacterium]